MDILLIGGLWIEASTWRDVVPGIEARGHRAVPVQVPAERSTTLDDAASVEVQFEDGSSVTIPVVWVSAPIDAGFFGYEVPAAHLRVGARPTLLILRDANGTELRRDSSAFEVPAFRQGPETGLAPCMVRGGGDACLKAVFGPDAPTPPLRPDPDPPSKHFHGQLPWRGR